MTISFDHPYVRAIRDAVSLLDPADRPQAVTMALSLARVADLELRDSAVRHARTLMPEKSTTAAAKEIATALDRYLASGYRENAGLDHITDGDPTRRAIHRIAKLNGGQSIGHRQIFNVLKDNRSGHSMQ